MTGIGNKERSSICILHRYSVLVCVVWTLVVLLSAFWNIHKEKKLPVHLAINTARDAYDKDMALRMWATSHGGVYVPVNETTSPNPYLSHVSDRDVKTSSGKVLTLMNPAYIMRQIMTNHAGEQGIKSSITSLRPLWDGNAPDEWERKALLQFEQGRQEVMEVAAIGEKPYLRLLRPLVVRAECLKCHAEQGYREGDVRGGVGVSVPMEPLLAMHRGHIGIISATHGLIWFLGLAGIGFGTVNIRRHIIEHKQAKKAMESSEARYRGLFNAMSSGVAVYEAMDNGSDFMFVDFNCAGERIEGVKKEDIVGRSVLDVFPGVKEFGLFDVFQRVWETGEPAKHPVSLYFDDSIAGWRENFVYKLPSGEIIAVYDDVTERKQWESALRESERCYRSFVTNFRGIAFRGRIDFTPVFMHGAVEEITGYTEEEFLRESIRWDQMIPEEDREGIRELSEKVFTVPDYSSEYVHRIIRRDGGIRWVREFIQNVCDENGDFLYVQGTIYDITDRMQSEEEVRKWAHIFQHSEWGVAVCSADGRILELMNPAFARMHGYTVGELTGRPVLDIFSHQVYEEAEGQMKAALEKGHHAFENVHYRKDGTGFPAYVDVSVLKDERGETLYRALNVQDITERKQAEEALRIKDDALASTITPIIFMDMQGSLTFVNNSALAVWGYSLEEVKGSHASGFAVSEKTVRDILAKVANTGKASGSLQAQRKDRTQFDVFYTANLMRNRSGEPIGMMASFVDITERKRVEDKLRRLAIIVEQAAEGIAVAELDGTITFINKAWAEMHGYRIDDLIGKPLSIFHTEEQMLNEVVPFNEVLLTRDSHSGEVGHRRMDGSVFPTYMISTKLTDEDNNPIGMVGFAIDITERKRMLNQLEQQALYDPLTSLPNRVLCMDRLKNLFEHRKRQGDLQFALLLIDLDHFKKINDSLGHVPGDRLLVSFAQRLLSCTRPGDTVARFGGDEFVVILDSLHSDDDALVTADRIHQMMAAPFSVNGEEIYITSSIGISIINPSCETPEEFLRDADTAMYQAKAQGRACNVVFDQRMHHLAVESMKLENDLHRALNLRELELYYQPIMNIEDGSVLGFEALMRWRHPTYGFLGPERFISLAEDSGMIVSMGEWAIEEACRQTVKWQREFALKPSLTVSVNLSVKQFDSRLPEKIERILRETDLPPQCLKLEITESIIMANAEMAASIMLRLNEMSVQVYLDDFGTGYSSLNYIHKFPFNALKIDHSFVRNIQFDSEAKEIVKSIVALAGNLNKDVIIEGIEDSEQLELFREMNCKYVQGFLYSEPLQSENAGMFLRQTLT